MTSSSAEVEVGLSENVSANGADPRLVAALAVPTACLLILLAVREIFQMLVRTRHKK